MPGECKHETRCSGAIGRLVRWAVAVLADAAAQTPAGTRSSRRPRRRLRPRCSRRAGPGPQASAPAHRGLVAGILVVASIIGVFAVLAVWANRQVLNTDNWTTTSARLLADPKIQAAVGAVLVNELFKQVDVADELKKVVPRKSPGLAAPAAAGLRALAGQVVPQVLATAPVQEAWRQANKTAPCGCFESSKAVPAPSRPKTARSRWNSIRC